MLVALLSLVWDGRTVIFQLSGFYTVRGFNSDFMLGFIGMNMLRPYHA